MKNKKRKKKAHFWAYFKSYLLLQFLFDAFHFIAKESSTYIKERNKWLFLISLFSAEEKNYKKRSKKTQNFDFDTLLKFFYLIY